MIELYPYQLARLEDAGKLEDFLDRWVGATAHWPLAFLRTALERLVKQSKWWPSLAEIEEQCTYIRSQLRDAESFARKRLESGERRMTKEENDRWYSKFCWDSWNRKGRPGRWLADPKFKYQAKYIRLYASQHGELLEEEPDPFSPEPPRV